MTYCYVYHLQNLLNDLRLMSPRDNDKFAHFFKVLNLVRLAIISKTTSNWMSWRLWRGINAGWRWTERMRPGCMRHRAGWSWLSPVEDWCIPLGDGTRRAYRAIGLTRDDVMGGRTVGRPWHTVIDTQAVVSRMLLSLYQFVGLQMVLEVFSAVYSHFWIFKYPRPSQPP